MFEYYQWRVDAGVGRTEWVFDLDENQVKQPGLSSDFDGRGLGWLQHLIGRNTMWCNGRPLIATEWLEVHVYKTFGANTMPVVDVAFRLLKQIIIKHTDVSNQLGDTPRTV